MSRTRTGEPPAPGHFESRAGGPVAAADAGPGDPAFGGYDALADLFLGEPERQHAPPVKPSIRDDPPRTLLEAAANPAVADHGPIRVEGLILGHLPVLASAWVHQYARHTAAQLRAPVALIKLRAGECSLELVGVEPENGTHAVDAAPSLSMQAAVAAAASRARVWLIRVDDIAEPHLADLANLDAVTLLTGAHEAAVVASYRTIKQLFKPAEEDRDGPEVRLAIMGAGVDRAADASQKLERAAETFLGRRVEVSACIAKVGPGRSTLLYRGPLTEEAGAVLQWLIPMAKDPSPARTSQQAPPPQTEERYEVTRPASRTVGSPQSLSVAKSAACSERPVYTERPAAIGKLASHISGLEPMEATCPYAPRVELAVDQGGQLHLLTHTGGDRALDSSPPPEAQLLTAGAWARAHWTLLQLSVRPPSCRLGPVAEPVMHVLSPDARAVRHLGDAGVRLHLLAPVQAGGGVVWFCTELN